MDSYRSFLPKLGHTRCYWALLSADLQFIYLDPVLAYHLDTQADLLVGKSLLSFVHPDEQASAKTDLRSVLDSRTLHGSVTRVRFSRLSRIRRQLGYQGPIPLWSDAEKIAIDANYIAVDIVINWAAEGLVLCFLHATVDLDPQSDNDEFHKSYWTNWCGTPAMPQDQIQLLFRRLLICVPQSPSGSHTRIFQILANQPGRQLLLSWPPDQGNGPTGREFAKLVENAEMDSGIQKGNDAKTSCTRRYRATQLMSPSLGEVESIFVPHGSVIFACHKLETPLRSAPVTTANMQHHITYNVHNGSGYPPPPGPSYYDPPPPYPPLAPPYGHGYFPHPTLPPPPSTYSPPRWSQTQQPNYQQPPLPSTQQQWNTPSPTHPVSPLPPPPPPLPASMDNNNFRSASYTNPSAPGPSWQPSPGGYEVYRTTSPTYGSYSGAPRTSPTVVGSNASAGSLPAASELLNTSATFQDVVPPPKKRVSPGSARGRDQYNAGSSGGRGSGNRPMGIQQCSSCGVTTSPEWRKGPSGKKELCNACGLRYARSRAKKDGGAPTQPHNRKKKSEKAVEKMNHHHLVGGNASGIDPETKKETRRRRESMGSAMTPPLATIAAAGGSPGYASSMLRRSFGSGSEYGAPGTSPSGSVSGSEGGHGHAHYAILAAGAGAANSSAGGNRSGSVLTPSPSPPASASVASASGSLALPLPIPSSTASSSTATHSQAENSNQDIGFVHYNSAQHERAIPPLAIHPHTSHATQSPHPQSPHPGSGPGHYVHSAYTTRPSPLSQAGNIVTGPAAGPLTPLSEQQSAKEESENDINGPDPGNPMQLPPLAYMDRVVGSNQINDPFHGSLATEMKPDYDDEDRFCTRDGNGNGMQRRNTGSGGGGAAVGREPLTPLSAESPIGPGVVGGSHGGNGRSGRRAIMGGQ